MKFVKIPGKDFQMSVYQTTQIDWCDLMPSNPSYFKGLNNPVESVSFDDVQNFIEKINMNDVYRYRLPTEEEWEYCCRAGSTTEYYFGDSEDELKDYAWFYKNSDNKTHQVGEKKPNAFGLYDMHGNVFEWTDSLWSPSNSSRVLRGGSWNYNAQYLRSANRFNDSPGNSDYYVGFRLVRTACNSLPSYTITDLKQKMWRAYRAKARREFLKLWKEFESK